MHPAPRIPGFGEQAPWFAGHSTNSGFHLDMMGGRVVVLTFLGSGSAEDSRRIVGDLCGTFRDEFDDRYASLFLVTTDRSDHAVGRLRHAVPGIRVFWDLDAAISARYGALEPRARRSFVLDQRLRVVAVVPFDEHPETHAARVVEAVRAVPRFPVGSEPGAPVLVVPNVLEAELCAHLIEYHGQRDAIRSGFMREVDGRTVEVRDVRDKRRLDVIVEGDLRQACLERIRDRLVPEIRRSFQFQATRIERYLVACYDGGERGFFRRHRDNTTPATAHRRFACTINLNTGDYEGGELVFPEFGPKAVTASRGAALVFSCSLLHEARPVTAGRRYALLPFLYDEASASLRGAGARQGGSSAPAPPPPTTAAER